MLLDENGQRKPLLADEVPELDRLRDPSTNPLDAAVFSSMSKTELINSIDNVLDISDKTICADCKEFGFGSTSEREELANTLISRKKFLKDLKEKMQNEMKAPAEDLERQHREDLESQHSFASNLDSVASLPPAIVLPEDIPELPAILPEAPGSKHSSASGYPFRGARDHGEASDRLIAELDPDFKLPSVEELKAKGREAAEKAKGDPFFDKAPVSGEVVFRGTKQSPQEIFNSGFIKKDPENARYTKIVNNLGHPARGVAGAVSTSPDIELAEVYARNTGAGKKINPGGYLYALQLNSPSIKVETSVLSDSLDEIVTPYVPPQDIIFAIGPLHLELGKGYELKKGELFINPDSTVGEEEAETAFSKAAGYIDYGDRGAKSMEEKMGFKQRYELREMQKPELPDGDEENSLMQWDLEKLYPIIKNL